MGVASLLCSLYPCFPNQSVDSRYHLQALRHLYVLAAQRGVLMTREAESGEPCCVPVQIRVGGSGVRERVTPCHVQDWEKLEEVRREGGGGIEVIV